MLHTARTATNPWTEQELVKAGELLESGVEWNDIEARMGGLPYSLRGAHKRWLSGKTGGVMERRREQRKIVEAMVYEGRTIDEIAAAIEVPYKTAYHRIINLGFTARDLREIRIELGLEERPAGRAPKPVWTAAPRRQPMIPKAELARRRRAAELERRIADLRAPHFPSMPAGARIAIEQVSRRTGIPVLDILGLYQAPAYEEARRQAIVAVWELYANRGVMWISRLFKRDHSGMVRLLKREGVHAARLEPEHEHNTFTHLRAA